MSEVISPTCRWARDFDEGAWNVSKEATTNRSKSSNGEKLSSFDTRGAIANNRTGCRLLIQDWDTSGSAGAWRVLPFWSQYLTKKWLQMALSRTTNSRRSANKIQEHTALLSGESFVIVSWLILKPYWEPHAWQLSGACCSWITTERERGRRRLSLWLDLSCAWVVAALFGISKLANYKTKT